MTSEQIEKRKKRLWRLVGPDADAMLLVSSENVRYLSGFTGTEGTLLLLKNRSFFLTDGRYRIQAKQQVKDYSLLIFREKFSELGRLIKKLKIKILGIEGRSVTLAFIKELEKQTAGVTLKTVVSELDNFRVVKSRDEINILKKAALIASESLQDIIPEIKPGIKEIEIAAELEYCLRKRGGDDIAFQTIVASGPRSALPHGVSSRRKINKGDFVIIDYGVVYEGYCSDETCTFVVGKPTVKQKKIYEIVKKAHDQAVKFTTKGLLLKDVDGVARRYINRMGYGKYFNHSTGHGIGLCVHEPPAVSPRANDKIKTGMVFTIEPGIYVPGWGGVRIEDTVVARTRGCEVITKSDKELMSVGF